MIILGLGSNLGDRPGYLRQAVERLGAVLADLRASRVVESAAVLPPDAPAEWNRPYLNMAVAGISSLSPEDLLAAVKNIESAMGRVTRGIWGPREIDIDILAMDDVVINDATLAVPHRELLNRPFALLPLAELAPGWRYPLAGTYYTMCAADIAAAKGFSFNDTLKAVHG